MSTMVGRMFARDEDEKKGLPKSAMIGIAVGVTVVVLAILGGVAFVLIRRRRGKKVKSSHGTPRMVIDDDDPSHLNERSSKIPLITQDDISQMREHHMAPGYDEDDENAPLAMPQRTLPPTYSAATQNLQTPTTGGHRRMSSVGGGLRPLSLVEAHDHDEHDSPVQTSPERKGRNRLSVLRPNGRARSRSTASRFREENVDA